MAATPDGSVVDEVNSGEQDPVPLVREEMLVENLMDTVKETPAGARLCGGYTPDPQPNRPISSTFMMLVSALTPDEDITDSIQTQMMMMEEDLKLKSLPPIFKGVPGERPDAHLLATADWMEAMRLKPT